MKRESETASAVGTECRPSGAVPADLIAELERLENDTPQQEHPNNSLFDRWRRLARAALRGRVVGGAAPGRELNVALLHADETALAANPDTMDFLALRILAAEVRRLTSAAPPPTNWPALNEYMAVGHPSAPITTEPRASRSTEVPSTNCAHFWDEGETACEHCGAPKP